jgi:hypothetical protein
MPTALEKSAKLELIQRSLGLKHKVKVLESMKTPESHEELASALHAKWELEDELHAIQSLLEEDRALNVRAKADLMRKGGKVGGRKKKS